MSNPLYVSLIPDVVKQYNSMHTNRLDIENPRTFTEKIQWLKIYDSTFLKTFCADKINVHKYYIKALGQDIGVPLIKIFKDANDITKTDISKPCAIKCNHGSGMNIVINAQHKPTLDAVKQKIAKWLHHDYGTSFYESHYSLIHRTAFSEQYIANMTDVKVFCFNGKPMFYESDHHLTEHIQNYYDLDWNPLTWLSRKDYPANYDIIDQKPPIDIIYDYAVKLCKPFKFVRCDFIVSNGHVYGGELTFTPGAGNQSYLGDGDRRLGDMLYLQ